MNAIAKAVTPLDKVQNPKRNKSVYEVKINDLSGQPINLENHRGKYILFVNVASHCGFTSQYKELQKLHEMYSDKLVVIGIPCNQFGNQEPGSQEEIYQFCEKNYGVTFVLTEKIDVKGHNQHPLYSWLTNKGLNNLRNSTVRWNFQKYLVSPNGELIDYYYSITRPLNSRITKHFD